MREVVEVKFTERESLGLVLGFVEVATEKIYAAMETSRKLNVLMSVQEMQDIFVDEILWILESYGVEGVIAQDT